MDGASWSARWPPPAQSAPPPPLPSQADAGVTPPRRRPFAAQQPARAAVPEQQPVPNPSRSQPSHGQPATTGGPSGASLARVPGSYSTFGLAAPDLTAMLDKLSAANAAAGTIDLTRDSALSGAAAQDKYPRHGLSATASSCIGQSSMGALFLNKSVNGMGTFTGQGSASNTGMAHGGVRFQDSSAHILQSLPFKPTTQLHPPVLGDRIRVSCLHIGGEFFTGEAGLFGVICLCHRLRMSVAKFCEHAGGPAERAGQIVRMENGMSIAQWFKLRIGVEGSIVDTKWDWPEWARMKFFAGEYTLKSLPPRNSNIGKVGLSGGYGKSTGPISNPVYSNDLYIEGGGCTNVEKLVNRPGEPSYRKNVAAHEAFTMNLASLQNSTIMNSGLAQNDMVHASDLNPLSASSGSLSFKPNMGRFYDGSYLADNYGVPLERNFDASFRNPRPSSTGVMNHDSRADRSDFPHKIFQDNLNSSSNTELKLGQSSYHQSMTTLFPLVQSAPIEFQKPRLHVPLINQYPCPKQTTKVTKSIAEHSEPPFCTGYKKQSPELVNVRKHSEGLPDIAANNSFISLFLSQLEGNSIAEPIEDILNSNEHNLPKAMDAACSSDHSKISSRKNEPWADNHSKLTPAIIRMKRRPEGISLSVSSSGYNPQDVPDAISQEPLIHGDFPSHLLPSKPKAGTPKNCVGVSCPTNCRNGTHVGDKPRQIMHAASGVPCFYDQTARGQDIFECAAELSSHRSLRDFAKFSCENAKCCCSSREFLPNFCQNDQSALGKSSCGCFCQIQEDVSKLCFRPGHLCRTHFSCDDGPILPIKPAREGPDDHCICSKFVQKSSLCSREHILQSPCCASPINEFHYRSSVVHTTDNLTKSSQFDALNKNKRGHCCDGRCCYSVVPKCSSGCGFPKHCDLRTDQIGHTVPKGRQQLQVPARCCTLENNEKMTCQCLSNRIAGRSISQASFSEHVSNTVMNQPSIAIMERLNNVSEASVADAETEKKGASSNSVISKGQLKFDCTSESSSAAVTKYQKSPEFNNVPSFTARDKHSEHKNLCDEGSRIEKCSASSFVPPNTECEESLKSLPRSQLVPYRVKRKCNQISDGNKLRRKKNKELCFGLPKKIRTLRCSASAEHSEPDDCTRTSSQSYQKEGSQPQNAGNSFSSRALRTKRKYPTIYLNKPVKRLHSQNKNFKDDDEQPDEKGIYPEGLNSSGKERQAVDMTTLDKTKHQQERNRMFVRKMPKYVSLNCIVNEPNSEDACTGSASIDSSVIATGIANDNRISPKIVPLSLILEKAKRCRAVKPLCQTKRTHSSDEKVSDCSVDISDCSVDEYSVENENCKPQAEDETHSSKKGRYSSNDWRPYVEAHYKSQRLGDRKRRASAACTRINRHELVNRLAFYSGSDENSVVRARDVNARRYSGNLNSDAPCCVCGISDLEPCNQLIECSKCYIKVHQACYGILKVPRGQWLCRPCKTNTQNTICVLCGYGGGAMTRALKPKSILKSLLKGFAPQARSGKHVDSSGNTSNECLRKPIDSAHGDNITSTENITSNSWTSTSQDFSLLVPRKMQWVHMVCGLWTPGTKCPNATTMSAFDVSGASPAKRNTACSMCNRAGGSFIKCRNVNCSALFHPWCAHQRGLLQSEPEGEHNENVGFYGRCGDHAIHLSNHISSKKECPRSNNWTCARTEGFKGRRGDCWLGAYHKKPEEFSGEFGVSQEQINAWLHINGSKSCRRRQEYINYKQLKGWKHLVVYKSGIHGLGLYTSVFIPRGSMVVEYVGEIVGQRVADKRELEYHSGKRQQYKSACYFFKIDKEHIIDATRKGGIARFVNHSCQPNCVAKIISVRNQKKVVFFAERHINPGEEITYDYHFNQEDEGQRIPCFCKSRYCRRYLN